MTTQKKENRILFIGDSISSNINIKALEVATRAKITTAKAYSSVHDTVSNDAKMAARFPKSNFTDVTTSELRKGEYSHLVLQAGSVDITNLRTKEASSENIEYFRQQTVISAKNIFQVCENAFVKSPTLQKVVLMKQVPRYDPKEVDPLGLKPALAQLFNNTVTELWMNSKMRSKIAIGDHSSIECLGAIKEARYRETKSGKYDGCHLFGSSGQKTYTLSVLNILRCSGITSSENDFNLSCAQYKYQERQAPNRRRRGHNNNRRNSQPNPGFTLPTYNRFNPLNQGNFQ